MAKENGFVHGSDLLVGVVEGTKVSWLGHSKSCTISSKSETKSRLHKEVSNDGMWDEKVVSKHSVSIFAEGFVCYDEEKAGYSQLVDLWKKGEPITVRYGLRGASEEVSPKVNLSLFCSKNPDRPMTMPLTVFRWRIQVK